MDVRNGDIKKRFAQQMQQRAHAAMLKDLECTCGSKVWRMYPLAMVKYLATDIRQTDGVPFAFSYECAGCGRWANVNDATNKWTFRTADEIAEDEKRIAAELEEAKEKVAAEQPKPKEEKAAFTLLE
jgi:hypothetical protein